MINLNNYVSGTSTMLWFGLFLLTYVVHIAEEYCGGGGYSVYLFENYGVNLPPPRFLALQCLGLTLMVMGILLATSFKFPHTMLVILGATVLINGLIHALRSVGAAQYGPGLVTAIGLWMPLGCVTLITLRSGMGGFRFTLAATIGIVINGLVEVIAMRGGKL